MRLLACLTEIFISTFGITRPKPEQQRLANIVIGGSLLTFSVAVLSVLGFLVYQLTAGSR
jgi:hypothetical protein